jgi:hypothetical protein
MTSKQTKQIMAGYFRTWRDRAADPQTNKTSMDEIPAFVDIALVFPWDTPPENLFWETLENIYVPALHRQGSKVVITRGIQEMLNDYEDTPAGHQAYVDMIMNTYINRFGLDGLDVDYEQSLSEAEHTKVVAIFNLLSTHLGPKSNTGKLLILDTNRDGDDRTIQALAESVDYLFLQAYGRPSANMTQTYNTFKSFLPAEKFLPGFSFYEEHGVQWNDVNPDRNSGRAFDYADWQPDDGQTKGGIFSYAIDRDIPQKTDEIIAADFLVTQRLVDRMKPV